MLIWSNYYSIILPLTFSPLYFGFHPRNHVQDICPKITHHLHNKLSFIHVYYVVVPYGSIDFCSYVT